MSGHSKWANIKNKKERPTPRGERFLPRSAEKYRSQLRWEVLIPLPTVSSRM